MRNKDSLLITADYIPGMVTVYDITTGKYKYVNKGVTRLLGYSQEEFSRGGRAFILSIIHPEDLSGMVNQNNQAVQEAKDLPFTPASKADPIVSFEYRIRHQNGSWRWMHTESSVYERAADGSIKLQINISYDITERKETELKLASAKTQIEKYKKIQQLQTGNEQNFRSIIEAVEDYAIFALGLDGTIMSWNEGMECILGYSQEESIGMSFEQLFTLEDRTRSVPQQELADALASGGVIREGLRVRKDGSVFQAVCTMTPIRDEEGTIKGFSKIMRDVTEKKEAEETIRYQAFHDTLTGLANRVAFYERFALSKAIADRHNEKLAILFLDVDRFKVINDTLGHDVGDLILKEVANRLTKSVRQDDLVARLGGDEFILMLNSVQTVQDATAVCRKIIDSFKPVMRVKNQSLHMTASIGIAMYPTDGADIQALLKNADIALYRAKDAGRNRFQFYNYSMNLQSTERLFLEQDLRYAIANNELVVEYQPFVEVKTGCTIGLEALLRWQHPTHGLLYPSEFIPLAEETGMIISIGNWVLKTVCEHGKVLAESGHPLIMSINLSAREFEEDSIVETIIEAIQNAQFKNHLLEIEITESMAMENIETTSRKLEELKQNGINIAIDDFGTGYSSLSYLKRFPVHKLKIDKSFIKHATTDAQDHAIVRAIVSMGTTLGLKVCAEGVETQEHLKLLTAMGCEIIQGFLISRSMRYNKIVPWLKLNQPQPLAVLLDRSSEEIPGPN